MQWQDNSVRLLFLMLHSRDAGAVSGPSLLCSKASNASVIVSAKQMQPKEISWGYTSSMRLILWGVHSTKSISENSYSAIIIPSF